MKTTSDKQTNAKSDAVEDLLSKAAPRPAPPSDIERDVRAAVRSEWQAVSNRSRRWRMGRNVAVAATVLLAVLVVLTNLRQAEVPVVEVARLAQSHGTLRLQGGEADTADNDDLSIFYAGQTLQTGADSAAGLQWQGGGSLRIDAKSRIEFIAVNEVYLHSGRIYFDSAGKAGGSELAIRTPHGLVSHLGTQFMTEADSAHLVVSVREGEVLIEGAAHDQTVHRGQRAELSGGSRPLITNTSGVGEEWAWVESVTPNISVDGMSAHEFLQWVGRETGYTVQYSNTATQELARGTELRGTVNKDPRTELRLRMLTMDLDARFDTQNAILTIGN